MENKKVTRGGHREGSGRPKNSKNSKKSDKTEIFQQRCNPEQKRQLQKYWEQLKESY